MYLLTYSGKTMKIHPHGSISIRDAGTQKPKLSLEGTTANWWPSQMDGKRCRSMQSQKLQLYLKIGN